MIKLRKSDDRGHADHGWLDSYHSFSFAQYHDPEHMAYSVLRVINEDKIAAGQGFGLHAHRDMEIITYMLAGELRHQDSLGNGSVIKQGDVQRMTAGSGIRHSEFNASSESVAHLLQIWILPEQTGLPPSYEEQHIPQSRKLNQWCLIASPDARENSLKIHQNVELWTTVLDKNHQLDYKLAADRSVYLQVARGQIQLQPSLNSNSSQQKLAAGDAAMVSHELSLNILAEVESELLLFDLPLHLK